MSTTRMPAQKRSIEKRNKIVEKGFELMCEKGYFSTNTTEIAKYASVSTGIIYQYFNDKKEIFIEGVKNYSNKIMFPMLDILETTKIDFNNLNILLEDMIDSFIKSHTISKKAHEELMAMSHLDSDIAKIFKDSELESTDKIVNILNNNGISQDNLEEKIHIIIGMVDNLCHDIVYHKHENINYNAMKTIVISEIIHLITQKNY